MPFNEIDIKQDIESLQDDILSVFDDQIEGWEPAAGNPEIVLAEGFSFLAAELVQTQNAIGPELFRYFGQDLVGIQAIEAAPATVASTWTAKDGDVAHTIQGGWNVKTQDGTFFQVVSPVTIPQGQTSTAVGEVQLVAVDPGTDANGISGAADQAENVVWVNSVALVGTSSGGVEGESTDAYLVRLSEELQLNTPTPILPEDFEVLARRVPGVGRATAVDLYKLDTNTPNTPKCVTVAVTDNAGEPLSATVLANVLAYLQSLRELGMLVYVTSPSYTTVDVAFSVKRDPNWDATAVHDAVVAALADFLSPARFGASGDPDADQRWSNTKVIRRTDLVWIMRSVEGVIAVDLPTINGSAADLTLTGVVTLSRPGTISGTVV